MCPIGEYTSRGCGKTKVKGEMNDLEPYDLNGGGFVGVLTASLCPSVFSPCSLMSGLATMDSRVCGKMGLLTITYYLWTTFMAVTTGIVLVITIHPGAAAQKEEHSVGKVVLSSADALLDLIRNMFPSNLVEASFQQVSSWPRPASLHTGGSAAAPLDFGEGQGGGDTVTWPPSQSLNLSNPFWAGLSFPSVLCSHPPFPSGGGWEEPPSSPRGSLVRFCRLLCRYFPFGIVFLIAGKILEMENPALTGKKLGLYAMTVVTGLAIHALCFLPLLFLILTRKNPFSFIRGILQALLIALATSSSSATLPITLRCLLENNRIDKRIVRFILPVGATINMDGTALYEAVAAIFIAQVNEYDLDLGQLITISITATAASIGAAGIPQSGLVTMVIVLTSVGLPTEDITLIIAIDWALDRLRTMTNVLGDALAAGIIAHIFRKEFAPKVSPEKGRSRSSWSTEGGCWLYSLSPFSLPPTKEKSEEPPPLTLLSPILSRNPFR
uniref:Amino acid transporter n=1 Tax=Naja naja TaxID=35670 RepID=A0A8C6VCU1_NAJNA